jgi:lipid A 4'-phosphatase
VNRTGIVIVLAIAVIVGVVFAACPGLDIWVAGYFFDPQSKLLMLRWWISMWRDASMWIIVALASPAVFALAMRLIWPRSRSVMRGRAILFLLVTLALAPGFVSNVILKNYWGRPRPIDIQQLGGQEHFIAWWDPRGDCPKNCSFVSGDVSGAFWTLAPAALVPPV